MNQLVYSTIPSLPRSFQSLLGEVERGIGQLSQPNYPPHNIFRKGDQDFFIELAVAGFKLDEIEVTVEQSELRIVGSRAPTDAADERVFLHRGLSSRDFRHAYRLGEYMAVKSATLLDGILSIHLAHEVPEEAKVRTVQIKTSA